MIIIKTAAVICEFNPFHNGHKYLIEQIKKYHADRVICIMSGNFVQRGDISITDKYIKTEHALTHGADAVIELPCVYANSNASVFASNGVHIASALKCDLLCFGIQDCSTGDFAAINKVLGDTNAQDDIRKYLKCGSTYPKALYEAVRARDMHLAEIMSDPNNILALEYIKACENRSITPVGIKRINVRHDSNDTSDDMASASFIRGLILKGDDRYTKYTDVTTDDPASFDRIKDIIVYRLKCMSNDDIRALPEISEGLENRIFRAVSQYSTYDEIISDIKTKRYTMSKLRRIMISALLNITDDMQKLSCPYIRVLGLRKDYEPEFSNADLPLICNVKKDREKLGEKEKRILDTDILASRIYTLAKKMREDSLNDYTHGIIKI